MRHPTNGPALPETVSGEMRRLVDAIPRLHEPAHEDMMAQALQRGTDLRNRHGLTAEDVGAIATLWAATSSLGFAKHFDGIEGAKQATQAMEDQYLLVQSILLSLWGDEGAVSRAMTYCALRAVLFTAPFTAQVKQRRP